MKENIKYFETILETNGYIINDIPFTGYIKENGLVIFNNDPNKMLIDLNGLVIIRDMVDAIFETLNDADGYIIETIPFSCYIKENLQLLECNLEDCKIVIENEVAVIKERGDIIRYTATSKVEPYRPSSLPTIISNDFDPNTGKGVIKFTMDVTSIGRYAFKGCSGLTSVTIPNSVTNIGNYAFQSCSGLTSVIIPNSVTSIGSSAFYLCTGLSSITIPNSVTSIGDNAFNGCRRLTSITIPNSVTIIETAVFYDCSGLTSVTIGNSVTSIEYNAFGSCRGLTSISYAGTISQYNSITKGSYWHYNVPATQVYCLGENPPAYTPI